MGKTIESVPAYIAENRQCIVPIMFLSEWKTASKELKKCYSQCLVRGFPRLQVISHKGNLANLLNKYYAIESKAAMIANKLFYPRTYVMPRDKETFFIENAQFCQANAVSDDSVKFIVKPQGKSKGNGISLASKCLDICFDESLIVQTYIANPFLISNHKFDLRLYLLIASVEPMQIYLYDRGLVRFASSEYTTSCGELCSHLTNYSLNKKAKRNKEIKWSLEQFWQYLNKKSMKKKEEIMKQIESMIRNVFRIGTHRLREGFLYSFSASNGKHCGRCFDLIGLDVLIDCDYKCWLMEMNRYPSLKCTHDIDVEIKYDLCNDLFTMLKPRMNNNHSDKMSIITR